MKSLSKDKQQTQQQHSRHIYTSMSHRKNMSLQSHNMYIIKSNDTLQQLITPRGSGQRKHEEIGQSFKSPSTSHTRGVASPGNNGNVPKIQEEETGCAKCQELQQQSDIYLNELHKIQEMYKLLGNRCQNLDALADLLAGREINLNLQNQSDITKVQELLSSISLTLQSAARNEIDLGFKLREIERKNIQYSSLQLKQTNTSEKNQQLQRVIEMVQQRNNVLMEENNKLQKLLNLEKKANGANSRKVVALEKRLEFLLENDVNQGLNPNDKLRTSLNELLRENEAVKRELSHKKQEIERLSGKINQYSQVVARLQKTIDNMKQKNRESESSKERQVFRKDDIDLLSNFQIPATLDYRVLSLKMNHQNLINDIMEKGVAQIVNQSFNQQTPMKDNMKEQFTIVSTQMASCKEFAEKLNWLQYDLELFSKCQTSEELIHSVNRLLPSIFCCEIVRLWLVDGLNGTIFTFLENRTEIRALQHKGQIADVFKLKHAQNIAHASQKPLIYRLKDAEQAEYTKNSLLLPVFCEGKTSNIRGVLEASNTEHEIFSFDEEYFGIILSSQLSHMIQRLVDVQVWKIGQKYRSQMMDGFSNLMGCQSRRQFQENGRQLINQIFGVSQSVFYFVEECEDGLCLHDYQNDSRYDLSYGLAGLVVQQKQGLIINDIKKSTHFNQKVDIVSILPIYAIPLISSQSQVLAVIEIVLKSKIKVQVEKERLISPSEGLFGMEEPLTKQFMQFVDLVVAALSNIKF